jgi:iron complex outermembrane receptor protein
MVAYRQSIDNFIQWVPLSGGIWSPENIKQIDINGIDLNLNAKWRISNIHFGLGLGYLFNNSITTESFIPNDASIGKQTIYTPEDKITGNLNVRWKSLSFLITSFYTGEVYARADHDPLSKLNAFTIYDAEIRYRFNIREVNCAFQFSVQNFTNQTYQTIKNYPMPGTNYKTGISIKI